jgi:hypothetical protein
VVSIELEDVDCWLHAPVAEAARLMRAPTVEVIDAGPAPLRDNSGRSRISAMAQ